ncbi:type III restriction enzyme [Nitzschia inconspicua]|uniref:Type III restriction enzyme n=1 Tax=Nitzschia inconspicua TaxID=303405 RepID=A0A9K3L975_9STRA|nr:type III restriction enzyme [Nitzschia inconspicua]
MQKRAYNAGKLAQGKIDLLNDLNFDWTLDPVATWEEMYEQLLEYYERFGSTLINTNINKELGMCGRSFCSHSLYSEYEALLSILSFALPSGWAFASPSSSRGRLPSHLSAGKSSTTERLKERVSTKKQETKFEKRWESTYQRLVKFRNEYGHTMVPKSFNDGDEKPHLGSWVFQQRNRYTMKDPPYPKRRAEKLNSIGFVWSLDTKDRSQQSRYEDSWNKTIQRLNEYKQQHGHTNVPHMYNDGQRPHLGAWVAAQRKNYRDYQNPNYNVGLMTKKRVEILESLGFKWNPGRENEFEEAWMRRFDDMKKFVKKYNTTKVSIIPKGYNDTIATTLIWAQSQRRSYIQYIRNETSTITPQQIDLLNSIDFAWDLTNKTSHDKWIHEYFKIHWHHFQHNNTSISKASGYNSVFGFWVEVQKRDYNEGKLAQGKIDLLNDLNFDWTLDRSATWEDMYEQLSQYYGRFGSTLINTKINRELGMWTNELRMLYNKGDLDSTWVAKLNHLNFDWKAEDVNWNAMFDRAFWLSSLTVNNNISQSFFGLHILYCITLLLAFTNRRYRIRCYNTSKGINSQDVTQLDISIIRK